MMHVMWILEDVCELGWSSIDDIMLLSMFVYKEIEPYVHRKYL
jgi:hypothetical protein